MKKYFFDVFVVTLLFLGAMLVFTVLGGPPANAQTKKNCEGMDFVVFNCQNEGEGQ